MIISTYFNKFLLTIHSFYKGHMQQMIDSQKGDEEVFVLDLFFKWCVNHNLKL